MPDLPPCRILATDDEQANRLLLDMMLTPLGFEVRTAVNGADAVAQAAACPPQVVLMDLKMPVMDGFEATRRLRAAHGLALKIIVLSAGSRAENQAQALAAGADAYLTKPFRQEQLLATLHTLAGVEFTRESPSAPAPAAAPSASQPPLADGVARLPVELVQALIEATHAGEYQRMLASVDQIARHDESLGLRLRQLVVGYDYGALLAMLEAGGPVP